MLSDVGGYSITTFNLQGESGPRKVATAVMTHGVLEALGIEPTLGRRFTAEEDHAGDDVVLLSHAMWTSEFAADPDIVGRTVVLDRGPWEILGVLPAEAALPESLLLGEPVDFYVPLSLQPEEINNRGSHFLDTVVRTLPNVDAATAATEIAALAHDFEREYPQEYQPGEHFTLTAEPIADWMRGPFVQPMTVLMVAVGFLLLVALANVAGLLLARTEERGRELAMRAALGAGLRRLAQQLAVENALLAVLGGALGVLGGRWLLMAMAKWVPSDQSRLIDPTLDPGLLTAALALAALAALIFGMLPLLHLRGQRPVAALRGTRTSTGGTGGRRLRKVLMVVQVAVALVLLTISGLLGRSFVRLLDVDPGYRTEDLVTTQVSLPRTGYDEPTATLEFWRRLVADVETRPGVRSASAALFLVLAGQGGDLGFQIDGHEIPEGQDMPAADWQVVMPGYFELLGIERLAGRVLDERDHAEAVGAVVVNRTFVETQFPGVSGPAEVIGSRMRLGGEKTQPKTATIIGVVPDIRHSSRLRERRSSSPS